MRLAKIRVLPGQPHLLIPGVARRSLRLLLVRQLGLLAHPGRDWTSVLHLQRRLRGIQDSGKERHSGPSPLLHQMDAFRAPPALPDQREPGGATTVDCWWRHYFARVFDLL